MMVDHVATATAEWHRTELIRTAANANRRLIAVADPPARLPTRGERERLFASLAALWEEHRPREIESADILGDWSCGYGPRHQAWSWPNRRAVLDWSVWAVLVCLAGYLGAAR